MYLFWNSIVAVAGFVSSVITIAMAFRKDIENKFGRIAAVVLMSLFAISVIQNFVIQKQDKIIAQKEDIAVHATRILEKTKFLSDQECISAYVSFLESVREIYPDSYERASKIEKKMDNSGYSTLATDSTISASVAYQKLHGIVLGVAALNE